MQKQDNFFGSVALPDGPESPSVSATPIASRITFHLHQDNLESPAPQVFDFFAGAILRLRLRAALGAAPRRCLTPFFAATFGSAVCRVVSRVTLPPVVPTTSSARWPGLMLRTPDAKSIPTNTTEPS